MPQPTASDMHINRPLTNVSILAVQEATEFIAEKVFPNIPSDKQSDLYFTYDSGDFNRDSVQRRADGAESAGDGWDVANDPFACEVFALHHDVSDRRRANTDEPLNEDEDATRFLTHKMLLKKETEWVSNFFVASAWTGAVAVTGGTIVSQAFVPTVKFDAANAIPISIMKKLIVANKEVTGFRCNTLVLGEYVWDAIQECADFLARITGGSTSQNPAILTKEQLAGILGIDRVLVAGSVKNAAKEGQTASNAYLYGDSALLCYVPKTAGLRQAAAGYTFTWKQYGAALGGQRMKKFRMEQNESDRVEIQAAWDYKVINAKMGVFMNDLLT